MTYLGLRPGEKLYEELLVKTEELDKTSNSMIFIERDSALSPEEINTRLNMLREVCETGDDSQAREVLRKRRKRYYEDSIFTARYNRKRN